MFLGPDRSTLKIKEEVNRKNSSLPTEGFVRLSDLTPILRVDRSTVYRWVARGDFPAPIKIGSCSFWRVETVRSWLNEKAPVIEFGRIVNR